MKIKCTTLVRLEVVGPLHMAHKVLDALINDGYEIRRCGPYGRPGTETKQFLHIAERAIRDDEAGLDPVFTLRHATLRLEVGRVDP